MGKVNSEASFVSGHLVPLESLLYSVLAERGKLFFMSAQVNEKVLAGPWFGPHNLWRQKSRVIAVFSILAIKRLKMLLVFLKHAR